MISKADILFSVPRIDHQPHYTPRITPLAVVHPSHSTVCLPPLSCPVTLTCTSDNCTNNAVHLPEQRGRQGESGPRSRAAYLESNQVPDLIAFQINRHYRSSDDNRNAYAGSGGMNCISAIATGECASCMHAYESAC